MTETYLHYISCAIDNVKRVIEATNDEYTVIVTPSAYGKDTSVVAGMAVISHLFAVVTIPLIFSLV